MKDKIKWPAGNRLDLCIPLRKITVTEEGTQFGEYIPSQAAVVMVYFVGNYASYEYTPRIEDNKLFITDNGELKPGVYAIDVRIQEPERKLRSYRLGELEIVRETRQLALGDFVLNNNVTLDADAFIFGEGPSAFEEAVRDGYTGTKAEWLESLRGKEGRGIADIVSLPTGAFRILLTDGSAYTTPILKGEQGVSISDIRVTGITTMEVLCTVTMSDGTTRQLNLPRGGKGEQGDAGEDGRGIQSVVMNNDYTITFSYTDGTSYTTPQALRGEQGAAGQDGQDGRGISSMSLDDDNHLTVSYTDGTTYTTPQSLQGERGVSITDFEQVGESATMCFFNVYYSNGNISQIGLPKGEQGDRGEPGPQGVKGDTVVLGEVGEYKLYNVGGTATDGAMTQDATTKAIAANTGYYECGTAAGTAAKVAVGDNEALYTLQKGGSIKVKMTNANAAASGVTLKIGSAAATPLYYNGNAVSASNTWEENEVISVYYDGTYYQASNSQGGGGKAEKIKYDNSASKLFAENVQGALDEQAEKIIELMSYEDVGISSISDSFGFITGTPPKWATNNNVKNSKVVPVNGGKTVKVTANANYNAAFFFFTSDYTEPTSSDNGQPITSLSSIDNSRHSVSAGESGAFYIPDDCAYIVFNVRSDNVSDYTPSMVELGYVLSDLMTEETGSSVSKIMSQNAVTKNIMAEEEINLSSLPIINCYMYTSGGNPAWQNGTATNDGVFIPVEPNCLYEVTGCLTGYGSPRFAFLKDNTHVTGVISNFATGWTNYQGVGIGVTRRYIAPSDAHYLFCNESSGDTQMLFSSVKKLTLAKDVAGENKQGIDFINEFPDYIIKNPVPVIFGEQNKGSLGANKEWTSVGGHRVVSVNEGDIFIIKGNRFYGWLTDTYTPPTGATTTPYVSGHDRVRLFGNSVIDTAPTGAAYLVISTVDGSGNPSSPWVVYKIDSYEERIQKFAKVRFGSWNVGQYRYVDCAYPNPVLDYLPVGPTVTHDVSAADADAVSLRFRKICNQANVDILGMCEYRPLYSESNLVAKDVLWQCYGNIYEGSTTGANNNTVAFNGLKYIGNEEIRYSSQISGGTRYYKHVTANLAGKDIHIVETHFEHSYPTERTAQMQQLITAMSSYEYVIIGGDFNTNLANTTEEEILQELAMFTDAGYKLANGGYIGRFMTHDEGYMIDNIAAKGFAMNNIQVIQEAGTLSDHWLIYCDLTLL